MTDRITIAAALTVLLALPACDNGPSAVKTRDRGANAATATLTGTDAGAAATVRTAPLEVPADAAGFKSGVTANRRETVDAKIARLYERNGAAFASRSPEDYLARMRAFIETPPAGVDTVKRPNGDTLYYQASTNTFAVAARDGTPRTMFKPDDGPAYWTQQKERAPTFGQRRDQN